MAIYGIIAIFFLLSFFKLISYQIKLSVLVLGAYDIAVILGILIVLLQIGAEINTYFTKHKELLLTLKRYYLEMSTRYDYLATKTKFQSECLQLLIEKYKELNLSDDDRQARIDDCINAIDYNIEILDYDSENNSLKLLGVKCTYELMSSIYTGLLSLGLAIVQYLYAGG